jgi:hypothetical protein
MAFKLHDLVIVNSKPESQFTGVQVGMVGFIDEVFDDDYYRFAAMNRGYGFASTGRIIGEGGIHGKYLAHHDGPLSSVDKKMLDIILAEREQQRLEFIAKIELRKIIEEGEDE